MKRAVILIVCVAFLGNAQTKQGTARVPFVGCAGGGQLGWVEAPTGEPMQVPIPWQAAAQLAYYKPARDEGVLAPRGWHCYYEYGSSGHTLFISPQKIGSFQEGFNGPLIELTYFEGFGSGRFDVWRIMARAFPSRREFVTRNLRDWQFSPEDCRFGPRPGDLLHAKSERVVAFQRAEGLDGFGPSSFACRLGISINSLLPSQASEARSLIAGCVPAPPGFVWIRMIPLFRSLAAQSWIRDSGRRQG
jgi:hypothetical protein